MADTIKKKKIDADEVMAVAETESAVNNADNAVNASTDQASSWQAQSDAYSKQADEYLNRYANGEDFSYDFNTDPIFQAAKQAYERSGKLAAEDVQGRASALSGGYANSYGATAAQQAYNQSIDNLYDTIPELENAAYNKYLNDRQKNLTLYETYQNKADSAENKANTAENKAYTYALQLAQLGQYDKLSEFLGVDLSEVQKSEEMQKALELALTTGDLSQLENYGINTEYLNRALNSEYAQMQAQYGDYSGLENLGIDTSEYQSDIANQKALNEALQKAQFGDYSALEALGYDMSSQNKRDLLELAQVAASIGDYSLYKELGFDTKAIEEANALEKAMTMAQYGDYSGLKKLGINVSNSGGGDVGNDDPDTGKLKASDISSIAKTIKSNFLGNYDPDYDATGDLKTGEINAFEHAIIMAHYDPDDTDAILMQAGLPISRINALWDYYNDVDKKDSGAKKDTGATKTNATATQSNKSPLSEEQEKQFLASIAKLHLK